MRQTSPYFSPDYLDARATFQDAVLKAGGRLQVIGLDARGAAGESLTIDIGWFGAERPGKLLLHCCGVHGVEAFAGSAVQLALLDSLPEPPDDTAVLFTHVLNPYGMSWLRRVNENNVDLNRNFLDATEQYSGAPEGYRQLDGLLNPPSAPAPDFFLPRALWAIFRKGMPALRQAVGGGQYEFPKGLMFGGARLEQGPREYQRFLSDRFSGLRRVITIDVHTGLGKYGEDTLLAPPFCHERAQKLFGKRVARLDAQHGPAYVPTGSIDHMLARIFGPETLLYLCQEFGTYGSITVVRALREENRWHHFGRATVDHSTKRKLRQIFGPEQESWRRRILERGCAVFMQAREVLLHGVFIEGL